MALRRLPAATFSVLTCTAPAVAALAGFAVLGQQLGFIDGVAVALVVAASMGAIRTASPIKAPSPAGTVPRDASLDLQG
jgi:inner membrane transporter RhtA